MKIGIAAFFYSCLSLCATANTINVYNIVGTWQSEQNSESYSDTQSCSFKKDFSVECVFEESGFDQNTGFGDAQKYNLIGSWGINGNTLELSLFQLGNVVKYKYSILNVNYDKIEVFDTDGKKQVWLRGRNVH